MSGSLCWCCGKTLGEVSLTHFCDQRCNYIFHKRKSRRLVLPPNDGGTYDAYVLDIDFDEQPSM